MVTTQSTAQVHYSVDSCSVNNISQEIVKIITHDMDRLTDRMLKDTLLVIQEDYEATLKEAVEDAREYTRQLLMMHIQDTLADFNNTLAELIDTLSSDVEAYLMKFENSTASEYEKLVRDVVYMNVNTDIAHSAMNHLEGPRTFFIDHLRNVSKLPKLFHDDRRGKAHRVFLFFCLQMN